MPHKKFCMLSSASICIAAATVPALSAENSKGGESENRKILSVAQAREARPVRANPRGRLPAPVRAQETSEQGHILVLSKNVRFPKGRGRQRTADAQALRLARELLGRVGASQRSLRSIRASTGVVNVVQVKGLTGQQVEALKRDSRIDDVEKEVAPTLDSPDTNPQNWGSDRIDQVNLPLDSSHEYVGASGIHIYILDTGVDASHAEFGGRVIETMNFTNETAQACDNHGTYSASFAAGATRGIARSAQIHDLKVATCAGFGSQFEVIAGINHVLNTKTGRAVINLSVSFPGTIGSLNNAAVDAVNQGVVFVTSSGNNYGLACIRSPNMVMDILTVGASAINDQRATFSNRGNCVDLHAPGVNVNGARNGGSYGPANGTSFSAPMVAGIAASIWSEQPSLSAAQVIQEVNSRATVGVLGNIPGGTANKLAHYKPGNVQANQPPTAIPGVNWSYVYSGRPGVQLDASQSSDPDNHTPLSYQWTQTLGPAVTLSNPSSATPTFTAPTVSTPTNLNFTLQATDSLGAVSQGTSLVSVVIVPDACTPYSDQAKLLDEFPLVTQGVNASSSVLMNRAKVEATLQQYVSDAQSQNAQVSGATLIASLKDRGNGATPASTQLPVAGAPLGSASINQGQFTVGVGGNSTPTFWQTAPVKLDRWYSFSTNLRPIHNGGGMNNDCTGTSLIFRVPRQNNASPMTKYRPVEIYNAKTGQITTISIRNFSMPPIQHKAPKVINAIPQPL